MTIIYVLIPLSLVLLALAVWAFFWAVKNDQFEDLDTPAMDILDDDERPPDRDLDRNPDRNRPSPTGDAARAGDPADDDSAGNSPDRGPSAQTAGRRR